MRTELHSTGRICSRGGSNSFPVQQRIRWAEFRHETKWSGRTVSSGDATEDDVRCVSAEWGTGPADPWREPCENGWSSHWGVPQFDRSRRDESISHPHPLCISWHCAVLMHTFLSIWDGYSAGASKSWPVTNLNMHIGIVLVQFFALYGRL